MNWLNGLGLQLPVPNNLSSSINSIASSNKDVNTTTKYLTINKQKYIMTSEEYSKYKKQYGKSSYNLLNNLVNSFQYKNLTDSQKQFAIEKVYTYANKQIKVDYAKQNNLKYEQSTLSQVTGAIKKVNGNTSNYFEFLAKTQDLEKDITKIEFLADSGYDEKTKKAIYENSLGKKDEKYNIAKETFTAKGLNTSKYLKFKSQEFESDKTDDGTLKSYSHFYYCTPTPQPNKIKVPSRLLEIIFLL